MLHRTHALSVRHSRPLAVGMGLVALDVVLSPQKHELPRCFAGGTCGNVLTVLSYLKWRSAPVSRLAPGAASDHVIQDLQAWNVLTDFVTTQPDGSTPIIIERIDRSDATHPRHSFSWRCPSCGSYLPGYRPVLASAVHELALQVVTAKVFFFDRVSRGVLFMAQACKKRGAVIVFEPSGVGDPSLFREAWSLAHVVKYSHERLRDIADVELTRTERESVLLEIETLGSAGLRYRSRLSRARTNGWLSLDAFPVARIKDTAGAGDWCTAGLLDKLARDGASGLRKCSAKKLLNSIRYGQALAAWNCGFEGARGGMYELEYSVFRREVTRILGGSDLGSSPKPKKHDLEELIGTFCPSCTEASSGLGTAAVTRTGA